MAAHVQPVTIVAGGMTVTLEIKKPFGDNSAYFAAQVEQQLNDVAAKFRAQLSARHGFQYTLEQARENGAL